jgi:DNA-directed RNA polymerase specialized sigma24 family protein
MDANHPQFTEYARTNIEVTARNMIGKCGLGPADLEDVVSELTLDLLQHLPLYNSRRGKLTTFIQVVVDGKSKRILRDRSRQKRTFRRDAESLDARHHEGDDGETGTLMDLLNADDIDIRLGHRSRSRHDETVLRMDVHTVIHRLPDCLRTCCDGIMEGRSISDLARSEGIPRKTFYDRVVVPIRQAFREAGYDDWR